MRRFFRKNKHQGKREGCPAQHSTRARVISILYKALLYGAMGRIRVRDIRLLSIFVYAPRTNNHIHRLLLFFIIIGRFFRTSLAHAFLTVYQNAYNRFRGTIARCPISVLFRSYLYDILHFRGPVSRPWGRRPVFFNATSLSTHLC